MTTWAVQPTDYGNEVKIWADVFDGSHFPQAKAHAERTAEQLGRPVTIWKVGSISSSSGWRLSNEESPNDRSSNNATH